MTTLGEKVAHVKDARPDDKHTCHWPGCPARVAPAMWGCSKHWYMLPRSLRMQIWRTYRPGQETSKTPSQAYIDTARAVQEWIEEFKKSYPRRRSNHWTHEEHEV
jgi:hypothetical protein